MKYFLDGMLYLGSFFNHKPECPGIYFFYCRENHWKTKHFCTEDVSEEFDSHNIQITDV